MRILGKEEQRDHGHPQRDGGEPAVALCQQNRSGNGQQHNRREQQHRLPRRKQKYGKSLEERRIETQHVLTAFSELWITKVQRISKQILVSQQISRTK